MTSFKNISASVRQKLLNRARSEQRPFAELLQYYAMERFLYRLSQSDHSQRFILKGALMLRVWHAPEARPTMDIDMLGRTSNDVTNIIAQISDILALDVDPDGIRFDTRSIRSEQITEDADYHGIRIRFLGFLDSARINMQIDIGFGDIIHPTPEEHEMPVMLEFAAPILICYTRESAIAEKVQAMVKLGILNSRMKDFYDIWLLSRLFDFGGDRLAQAIRVTFEQRGTPLPDDMVAFHPSFIAEKQVQWTAFRKRLAQPRLPEPFLDIVEHMASFLKPVMVSIRESQQFEKQWSAAAKDWV